MEAVLEAPKIDIEAVTVDGNNALHLCAGLVTEGKSEDNFRGDLEAIKKVVMHAKANNMPEKAFKG